MTDLLKFRGFIVEKFSNKIVFYDEFKSDLHFVHIDCLKNEFEPNRFLNVEISNETISFSTISKEHEIDFSLYDFVFYNNEEAEFFLEKTSSTGKLGGLE